MVDEWARSNFRSNYRMLGGLREQLMQQNPHAPRFPLVLLSAIPTRAMWARIRNVLQVSSSALFTQSSIRRDNLLLYKCTKGTDLAKTLRPFVDAMLEELTDAGAPKQTIVYAHDKKQVEKLQSVLDRMLNHDDASERCERPRAHARMHGWMHGGCPPASPCICEAAACSRACARCGRKRVEVVFCHGLDSPQQREGESEREFKARCTREEQEQHKRRDKACESFEGGKAMIMVANDTCARDVWPHRRRALNACTR